MIRAAAPLPGDPMRHLVRSTVFVISPTILAVLVLCAGTGQVRADYFAGRVSASDGAPIEGAMVSFSRGEPAHEVTVYTGADGAWRTPALAVSQDYRVRVRRIGWKDHASEARLERGGSVLPLVLERETDPASVAGQLPANRWFALVLEQIEDEAQREELVRQCTYCHQQGNWSTRMQRPEEQWNKVLHLMARMGAGLSSDVRAQIPELFNTAYALETAVPRLTENMLDADFAPPPAPEVQGAVVEEWALGHQASMQHDLMVHPDGRIYSVDMMQDQLYRLDPADGSRASFQLPRGDLPLGGVFGTGGSPVAPNANAHVGPHSLQHAPDGGIWITLALGNQLGRFDPVKEDWMIVEMDEGYYPHTLRFDGRGRVWYTVAASNHVGVYDPASGEHDLGIAAQRGRHAVAEQALHHEVERQEVRELEAIDREVAGFGQERAQAFRGEKRSQPRVRLGRPHPYAHVGVATLVPGARAADGTKGRITRRPCGLRGDRGRGRLHHRCAGGTLDGARNHQREPKESQQILHVFHKMISRVGLLPRTWIPHAVQQFLVPR